MGRAGALVLLGAAPASAAGASLDPGDSLYALNCDVELYNDWQLMPNQRPYDNAFKVQWELFLRHVVLDEPFRWGLLEGAKGVQLAELGYESSEKRCWVDVPSLG